MLLLLQPHKTFAGSASKSAGELALYQGADRERILIEGAKREGQFTLYTSHTWFRTFVKDFEKKYPFIKTTEWRNDSKNIIRKVLEEAKSGRVFVDVVETTDDGMGIIRWEGLLQEYYSPQARYYPNELLPDTPTTKSPRHASDLDCAAGFFPDGRMKIEHAN